MPRWFITLSRGETPTTATPVIAITDARIVNGMLRTIGKELGIVPTPLRAVVDSPPEQPEDGARGEP